MIDFARITVTAGSGGNGGSSQRQIKGKRYSKADGGNGGNGGNVYIEASSDVNTLEKYRYVKDYKAENGKPGLGNQSRGATAPDLVLKVPTGTQITVSTNPPTIYDLIEPNQNALLARGGIGGRGNAHMRDEFGRRPYKGEKGTIGETVNATFELKLIAEVGLIGLPNAGKSTLLSKLTAAKPQIAAYPFTTLEPNLGVLTMNYEPSTINYKRQLVLADIPGLIEGASEGRGLGHLFLRHVERTRLLVHLIDATSSDPWKDYQTVRNELINYSKELAKKKEIIALTKIDLIPKETVEEAIKTFKEKKKKVIAISTQTGEHLSELTYLLRLSA